MIKDIIQEAFILKSKGYYKNAIESFYRALGEDNSSIELLYEISECYFHMDDYERALNYLEQVLETSPTHINGLKLLKKIFIKKQAWNEAEQTAKNIYCVTQSSKDLAEILELLNKQNRFDEVFDYQIDIKSVDILYEKAYAKFCLNKLEEAEMYINQALEENIDEKNILLKGKILYRLNRINECLELLKYIEKETLNPEMLNFLGLIKLYECQFKEALKYFIEASRIDSSKAEYIYNCASAYFKMDEVQQAKKFYNLAISLEPDNRNYHLALANLYYSEKHYKRAMEELKFDFFEANLLKSIILYDSGYLAIAKTELDKLLKEQPENELILDYKNRIETELKI